MKSPSWANSPNAQLLHNARIGNLEQVTESLENGANVNFQWGDPNHATPLIHASSSGHLKVVQLLLENKAKVDQYGLGYTALMRACDKGHVAVVRRLLSHGADMNLRSKPLGNTPLMFASSSGHFKVSQLLLEKGAKVDQFGLDYTALMRACDKGHGAVVRLLLSHGADVNLKSKTEGRTPLMLASLSNHVLVTELLLSLEKTKVEEKDRTGYTALILMCMQYGGSPTARQRWLLTMQLLLRNGANPNYHTGYMGFPLLQASMRGYLDMVKLLVQYGAKDDEEERALKAAKANNHQDVSTFLELPSDKQKLYYLKFAFSPLHTLNPK